MSIAEKLQTIAENEQKVYNTGYTDGLNSVVNYGNFCSHIRFNNLNVFGKSEVVLDLPNVYDLSYLCSPEGKKENTNTTVEHITINCSNKVTTLRGIFSCNSSCLDYMLKRITFNVNTEKVTNAGDAFENMQALEEIDGIPFDFSSGTLSNAFSNCPALKEVRFVENSIPLSLTFARSSNLSDESIQSIIDGLADLTGETGQTITFHATVGAKLTDEQKTTITAKNWTLAY